MIISVDGLIGCGKTTLLDRLEKRGFQVFRERVSEWKFLNKFYAEPKKYALALQLEILTSLSKYDINDANTIVFTERCPQISNYVFAKMMSKDGLLTDEELTTYTNFYDKMKLWRPDVHIFLNCPHDVSAIRQQGRADDYVVDFEYMKKLEKYYSIYNRFTETPVKYIDASNTPDEVEKLVIEYVNSL